jgi:hypothetical protein
MGWPAYNQEGNGRFQKYEKFIGIFMVRSWSENKGQRRKSRSRLCFVSVFFFLFVRCDWEIATDYSFTCPSAIHVCLSVCLSVVVGTDKNWNFSAVRSPIGLKLSGDHGLVSQISVHDLLISLLL